MNQHRGRGSDPDQLLLGLALDTARQAAALVRRERPPGRVELRATKTSATDPVTAVDVASERLVRDLLATARPGDVVLGEEDGVGEAPAGQVAAPDAGITWVVDPIDGTTNFVYGVPAYAVSIAAVRTAAGERASATSAGGTVVAGVVVDVVSGTEFTAVLGGGASMRAGPQAPPQPLSVIDPGALDQALVATGFSYDPALRAAQGAAVARLLPQVRDVRRFGAASLDLCALAAGRVDAYVEQGLKPWDLAAGGLVAREAGALITGLHGEPAGERLVVACAPGLHPALSQLVADCGF